jgi:hypothetical protein
MVCKVVPCGKFTVKNLYHILPLFGEIKLLSECYIGTVKKIFHIW